MPVAERDLWLAYKIRYGWVADRLEGVVANSGSAVCHAWGARVKAEDIIPRFGSRQPGNKELVAALAGLPGVKVRKRPRKGNDDGRR